MYNYTEIHISKLLLWIVSEKEIQYGYTNRKNQEFLS